MASPGRTIQTGVRYYAKDVEHLARMKARISADDSLDAIQKVKNICGATNPEEADPVSIRGAYGRITTKGVYENAIHASANPEESEREIKLWFAPDEIISELYPTKAAKKSVETRVWA